MKEVLSKYERQMMILALESNINNTRYDKEEIERNIKALYYGYTNEYFFLNLYDEMSKDDQELVYRILEMFRYLKFSLREILDKNKSNFNAEDKELIDARCVFDGFDLSRENENYMIGYVIYLFEKGLYPELHDDFYSSDKGNSHSQRLPYYKNLLGRFESITRKVENDYLLTSEDIRYILKV